KVKGNMDIELAVDAMEIAQHIDHMILFSGDGDFSSLVKAMKRRGVRVTVVSTVSTQPPMVADELRREADIFTDIVELQPKIGRDPAERAAREREPRHTPQFLQRAPAPARAPRRTTTSSTKTEQAEWRPPGPGGTARAVRGWSLSASIGARASPIGSTRRCPRSARARRALRSSGSRPGCAAQTAPAALS